MQRLLARPFLLYGALHGLLFLGLYQLGFTPDEWRAREARARAGGVTTSQLVRTEQGALGLLRAYLRTDSDERLYREYARLALTGRADFGYIAGKQYAQPQRLPDGYARPYRDVRVEYPPLALYLGMVPPALISDGSYRGYRLALGAHTWLLHMLSLWVASRLLPLGVARERSLRILLAGSLLFCLLLGNIVATRIDGLVALCCVSGALAVERCLAARGQSALYWASAAGALLALGALIKVAPGLLLAPAGLLLLGSRPAERSARLAGLSLSALGLGAIVHGLSWWLYGDGYLATFAYHAQRGIQLESSYGGLLLLTRWLGAAVSLELSYGSSNLASAASTTLAQLAPWLFFVAACFLLGTAYRRGAQDMVLLGAMLLTTFLLTNKVFSPQYLLWLLPLVLLHAARSGERQLLYLLLAAALLSQVIYPRAYGALKHFAPALVLVLNVRNLLLLALWLRGFRLLTRAAHEPVLELKVAGCS